MNQTYIISKQMFLGYCEKISGNRNLTLNINMFGKLFHKTGREFINYIKKTSNIKGIKDMYIKLI